MVTDFTSNNERLMRSNLITKDDLVEHFKEIGLQRGMVVYVQSSMDYFSHICGGNRTIIEALQDVIGYEGTIVTSAFNKSNIDPLCKDALAYKPYQIEVVRDALPAFNKKLSTSNNELANQMMRHDGVFRSSHPVHSFLAWGKYAKLVCDKQPLHFSLSKDSPLGRVSELNGYVLLLGVKYEAADIFKTARESDCSAPIKIVCCPIEKRGKKSFISMLDFDYQEKDITEIITMMEERQVVSETYIGRARCRFFSAKEAITLASAYYNTHKG